MADRETNIKVFNALQRLISSNEELKKQVTAAKAGQYFAAEGAELPEKPETQARGRYEQEAQVSVTMHRTIEAAIRYRGKKVCVLNFASATHPGGGVEHGANAQEEAICRVTTLFNCLTDDKVLKPFHEAHIRALRSGKMTKTYNDDCIYTPGVTVVNTDTNEPQPYPQSQWTKVDVITCAAPNLNDYFDGISLSLDEEEIKVIHKKRIRRILDIAVNEGEEVMILGAFGCGAFQNPPQAVAQAMKEVISDYLHDFEAIEFGVYCSPRDRTNYYTFQKVLGS